MSNTRQSDDTLNKKLEELATKKDVEQLKNLVNSLRDYIDIQNEQYSRRYCLRIKGISKEKDESSTKCIDKVVKVCESLKINITKADIDRAHRVGEDRSTMIVKFFSFVKRTSLYKARKDCKDKNIYLDITKNRLNWLKSYLITVLLSHMFLLTLIVTQ